MKKSLMKFTIPSLTISAIAAASALATPLIAFAYAPVWIGSTSTPVTADAGVARGYFGVLSGSPQVFNVSESQPVRLYVTVLQPAIAASKEDLSVAILDSQNPDIPLGVILGPSASWTPVTYQGENYMKAPDFRATLPAGDYRVQLWSGNNDAPYAIVIGEDEPNIFAKIRSGISALPQIERYFFNRSGASAISAPLLLWPLVIAILIIAAAIWALSVWRFGSTR